MPSVTRCSLDRDFNPHSVDERNRGTSRLRYFIQTDGPLATIAALNGALSVGPHPLPSLWSQFSYLGHTSPYVFARQYTAVQVPKKRNWIRCEVEFRPLQRGETFGVADVDPLLRPPVYDWDREIYMARTDFDQAGNPILNKAGKRYEDPAEEEESRGVFIARINVANLAAVITHDRAFTLTTNSTEWDVGGSGLLVPARAAFCRMVDSERQVTEGGTDFFTEEFRIALKGSGQTWDRRFKEHGFEHYYKDESEPPEFVVDEAGNKKWDDGTLAQGRRYAEPVLLAADGTRLADGEDTEYTDWRVKREADFNTMPFN